METTITRIGKISKIEIAPSNKIRLEIDFSDGYLVITVDNNELGQDIRLRQEIEVSATIDNLKD